MPKSMKTICPSTIRNLGVLLKCVGPVLSLLFFTASLTPAAVLYVDVNNANPAPPYTNWSTAAANIQDAVDAAVASDQILVTNGVYRTGGRVTVGALTNRLAVDKALLVQSVNGPQFTKIQGYQLPDTTLGDAAIRCVYLTNGATLSGFTLFNGGTKDLFLNMGDQSDFSGGGVFCESTTAIVSNCVASGNWAGGGGGGVYGGSLYNCTLTNNAANLGGGACSSVLKVCTLTGNHASLYGGGAEGSILNNCTLSNNVGQEAGGGASECTLTNCALMTNATGGYGGGANSSRLYHCTLTGNSAEDGGGVGRHYNFLELSILENCTLTQNRANIWGGGAYSAQLNNCALVGNSAAEAAGGAGESSLGNCTLVGNSAGQFGGGVAAGVNGGGLGGTTLDNCILYYNTAPVGANYYVDADFTAALSLQFCCTTPMPTGMGNITNAPSSIDQAVGNLRLQSNSACIRADGDAVDAGSTDLDGRPRITGGTIDIGAYEFQPGTSGLFIAWLQQYGLPTDGSADFADTDNDGMNNWNEWAAGTVATNASSVLRVFVSKKAVLGVIVRWQSVNNRTYFLERATDLGATPPFSLLASNLVGQVGTTSFTDTNATGPGPFFYRVGVQP